MQAVYVVVGRHVPQDALGRRRALEPARAVPEHGFDHMVQPHAPVFVEHDPYLPVHPALYGVVGGGNLAVLGEVCVQVGEQGPLPAKLLQPPSRLPEPLVPEPRGAVDHGPLLQKRVVIRAPAGEGGEPGGGVGVLDLQQPLGDAVEVDAGLRPRARRRAALDLLERVEGASLHARRGPLRAPGPLDAAPAVGDDDVGRRDAGHERRPRRGALAAREVPPYDVSVAGQRDQHDAPAFDPDAVDVDDVVDLVACGADRPYLPESRGGGPERAGGQPHLALGPLRQKPAEEQRQLLGIGVALVAVDRRRPASRAAPAPPPCARRAVPLHSLAARRATHRLHPSPIHRFLNGSNP